MSTESDFTRTFPPWENGTKASGVPLCWLIIAGHLEETFHRQNYPLLLFRYCLQYNVRTGFCSTSTARHLKTSRDLVIEKLTIYFNSAQKMLFG